MKPLPSNQPFSSNDINYIVLLSLQHPAIKSNHGSLANLFMHEAAVSFLPCFHPPPPFFALHEHDVHSEGRTVPKLLRLRCSAQSHRAPCNAPEILPAHSGVQTCSRSQPVTILQSAISGAQSGFMVQSWQKHHDLKSHLHHPGANPGSCCWNAPTQCGTTWGFIILVLGTCFQKSVLS